MANNSVALVGDVGGTNARFALVENGVLLPESTLNCATSDYPHIANAITAFLAAQGNAQPVRACLALATAITGDEVKLTNCPWGFSQKKLSETFGFKQLMLVNDFTALAMGVPTLSKHEYYAVGGGAPIAQYPIGIVGPGTGFGVSGLVWDGRHWVALQGEGGHAGFAPSNDIEIEILRIGQKEYGRLSVERVLSGAGLEFLYRAMCQIKNTPAAELKAADITKQAAQDTKSISREVVDIFCGVLGSVAGDHALMLGARGGVYIGGGIVPKLGEMFTSGPFRARFESKGRFKNFVSSIPTYVMTESHQVALLGAAAILNNHP